MKSACAIVVLSLLFFSPPALAGEPLILGVHPFLPATELTEKFRPLADYLGRATGLPVQIEISRDYRNHVARVGAGDFDIAYMGPVSYVRLVEEYGAVPLLGRLEIKGSPTFQGAVFVREESPIRTVADLADKRVAFVTESSTMGFIVPRYVLEKAGVPLERLGAYKFLNNHENVALAVLVGDFDAGAVKEETFERFASRGARAIAMTPPIPEHLFVSSPGRPAETVDTLGAALLRVAATPEGLAALRAVKAAATNIVPAEDGDYDLLRKILRGAAGDGRAP